MAEDHQSNPEEAHVPESHKAIRQEFTQLSAEIHQFNERLKNVTLENLSYQQLTQLYGQVRFLLTRLEMNLQAAKATLSPEILQRLYPNQGSDQETLMRVIYNIIKVVPPDQRSPKQQVDFLAAAKVIGKQ